MTSENHATPMSPIMVNQANLSAIRQDSVENDLSSSDISTMFNEFLVEFERMEKSGHATIDVFLNAVEQIADAVLLILPHKLLDPRILYHPLMHFLQQMLVDILQNWRSSLRRLNIQETDIFLKIVLIFVHAAEQAPAPTAKEHRIKIRDLLATKRFLFLVQEQVVDIVINKPDLNDDPNICTLGLLTIKLLQGCPFYYSVERNQSVIEDLVTNCLDSYDYIQAVRQLQHNQPLADVDLFLLYTCWEHLPSGSATSSIASGTSKTKNSVQYVYDQLLTRLERALDEPPPCTTSSIAYIFERCNQLLNIGNLPSFNDHAKHIIDRLTNILQTQLTTQPQDQSLITVALEAFHNLSQNPNIRAIIKQQQLTTLFHKYTSSQNNDQRKLTFGILAEIMDEKEINNNLMEIAVVFIDQLKQLKPQQYQPDLDTSLSTLKGLMQHDHVKNEIIKQGGVDILISFVRDGDLNVQSNNQIEDALEILWSCTFDNPQIVTTLKQDAKLMTRVNQIFNNAKQNGDVTLEKAADGLIWKVEKEEKFIEQRQQQQVEAQRKKQEKKQKARQEGKDIEEGEEEEEEEEEEEQYDLMISYSWADMDLAHRIYHHLTDKLGYKIWLDQEQMHGSTIEAMANAVDNAQFILMCMSETYKRSANCKSEAEYAFNRKKHIVPCKMKKDYVPDGWLGFILGTRLYIDFGTYEFDKAIGLLDNEIQLQKKKRKEIKVNARIEEEAAAAAADNGNKKDEKIDISNASSIIKMTDNSENVSNWSEGKVRNFLLKHSLGSMVPLCDGINGEELFNLYTMCKTNSTSMYRSLKFELLHGHHRILPISTFLRFMSLMRSVLNDRLPSNTRNIIRTHEDPFPDED